MDEHEAKAYVSGVRWRFAKTMPEWPHEYTVKAWRLDLYRDFEAFCQHILDRGAVEAWPPAPVDPIYHNHYLVIGPWKYWAMGPKGDADVIADKSVINRAAVAQPGGRG